MNNTGNSPITATLNAINYYYYQIMDQCRVIGKKLFKKYKVTHKKQYTATLDDVLNMLKGSETS